MKRVRNTERTDARGEVCGNSFMVSTLFSCSYRSICFNDSSRDVSGTITDESSPCSSRPCGIFMAERTSDHSLAFFSGIDARSFFVIIHLLRINFTSRNII